MIRYNFKHMVINEEAIFLQVYKHNRLLVDGNFDLRDIDFKIRIASASQRGVSYKLLVQINEKEIVQYEIHGWKKTDFDRIVNYIYGQGSQVYG